MNFNYQQCAVNCVGAETFKQYMKRFNACNQDFDLLFSTDTADEEILQKNYRARTYLRNRISQVYMLAE